MPDVTQATLLPAQGSGVRWAKLETPVSNGFVGDGDATFSEQVLDIAETEREPRTLESRKAVNGSMLFETEFLVVRGELLQDFASLPVHLPLIGKDVLGSDTAMRADLVGWDLAVV